MAPKRREPSQTGMARSGKVHEQSRWERKATLGSKMGHVFTHTPHGSMWRGSAIVSETGR
jgi:hypothetical protein